MMQGLHGILNLYDGSQHSEALYNTSQHSGVLQGWTSVQSGIVLGNAMLNEILGNTVVFINIKQVALDPLAPIPGILTSCIYQMEPTSLQSGIDTMHLTDSLLGTVCPTESNKHSGHK